MVLTCCPQGSVSIVLICSVNFFFFLRERFSATMSAWSIFICLVRVAWCQLVWYPLLMAFACFYTSKRGRNSNWWESTVGQKAFSATLQHARVCNRLWRAAACLLSLIYLLVCVLRPSGWLNPEVQDLFHMVKASLWVFAQISHPWSSHYWWISSVIRAGTFPQSAVTNCLV